jgi:tricorn protease
MSLLLPIVLAFAAQDHAQPPAGMLRFPDVSATHIVFAYANDLWLAPRDGGQAVPLASPAGLELFPRFSDDGRWIVFQGNYDGNRDLYVMPSAGGQARRLTHHPSSETPMGWTPDGRVLFASGGYAAFPKWTRLLTVGATGGLPEPLPLPYGTNGAIHADGRLLAFTPHSHDGRTWKRYRGGMATDIWLFDLQDRSARRVTGWEGTDSQPMWHGDVLYYFSDAGPEHRLNLWKYDLKTEQNEQVTRHTDYDVKWPAIGPDAIVYQLGADLMLLELASGLPRKIEVTVPGDGANVRPQIQDAADNVDAWDISRNAKRVAVSARGDIWTLPAKEGPPRAITRTDGVAERWPAWSPDGRWIAYFTDASGDYEVAITQSDGKGETKVLTSGGGPFKTWIQWSPDSKRLLFGDKSNAFFLHTIEGGATVEVDREPFGFFGSGAVASWSHDSRWITWSRTGAQAPIPAIFVYEIETAQKRQLTSGFFGESNPTFDRKGDWLFYVSNLNFEPTYSSLDTTFVYRDAQRLMALPLRAEVKSPWLPESDEETWSDEEQEVRKEKEAEEAEEATAAAGESGADDNAPAAADDGFSGTWTGTVSGGPLPPGGVPITAQFTLDADGSVRGSLTIPMGIATITSGQYDKTSGRFTATLQTEDGPATLEGQVTGNTLKGTGAMGPIAFEFTMERQQPSAGGGGATDDEEKDDAPAREKVEIEFDGAEARAMMLPVKAGQFGGLGVNDSGHLLFVRIGDDGTTIQSFNFKSDEPKEETVAGGADGYSLTPDGKKMLVVRGSSATIQGSGPGATGDAVPTAGMNVTVDPRVEWRQIVTEAWRLQRDYFYDPNMHGVNWDGMLQAYLRMADHCTTRDDVNYVLGEMIAELNVGHAYVGGFTTEEQPSISVGMLGVDWTIENGAFRIAKIQRGSAWDADARGPLGAPGCDVKEGDYLLAVNGIAPDASQDPWAAFQGMANRATVLTVHSEPARDGNERDVVVTPDGDEFDVRFRAWIESKRRFVEEASGGKLGYLYVTDTGTDGQNDLVRQFYPQIAKEGLIIDERWNGGGQIPTRFIELLDRPATNMWAGRDGRDWHWPPDSHQGPKCMLINGLAGSGGDAFPAYFKLKGLGKLIGQRTWGGLVGISGNPSFVDGSSVTVPTFAWYDLDGTWGIEGHGVDPDMEVMDHPTALARGEDPQLDAAIAHMLDQVALKKWQAPERPAYPNREGMGIPDQDK